MTTTEKSTQQCWHMLIAAIFLLFGIDALFVEPRYLAAGAYIALTIAYSLKAFSAFESWPWSRFIFNMLGVIGFVFMVIHIGSKFLAK